MSITTDYTAMHRAFRVVARRHGVRPSTMRVAMAIDEHGVTTPVALAGLLDMHGTAVCRALRELESIGLVEYVADEVREGARA